jgi:FAD/FMN-containing dehydrogenase
MSKVAKYLNEHILGEVVTEPAIRARFSTDASVLTMTPEMVIYPRVTNDIRKVARFAWQLAEKGHVLPLTARGGGTDDTGAAISKGAIISLTAHMNTIFELDTKQKLVRVQPGANEATLQAALALQGMTIPAFGEDRHASTVGGAIAYNAAHATSGRYGAADAAISQLEVVLANGDVLQTERLSKRDLNKKKGVQGFEGDIYRKLDALIDDNKELITSKLYDVTDAIGYSRIRDVKHKDGSFDLAPLIAGSQGTLGIISEMILKTEFLREYPAIGIMTFTNSEEARDAVDAIAKTNPSFLEYFDATFFDEALKHGKHYAFYDEATKEETVTTVLVVGYDDFSGRARHKALKKLAKIAKQFNARLTSSDDERAKELAVARDVTSFVLLPALAGESAPPLFDGAFVPFERFEDFSAAVAALAAKHHVLLPLYARPLDGIVSTRPNLQMKKVGDKQKIFKLLDEYANVVAAHNGYLVSEANEGRLKTTIAYKQVDDDLKDFFKQVKDIFDPFGILNPGVKQPNELKQLVADLRTSYDTAAFADTVPHN